MLLTTDSVIGSSVADVAATTRMPLPSTARITLIVTGVLLPARRLKSGSQTRRCTAARPLETRSSAVIQITRRAHVTIRPSRYACAVATTLAVVVSVRNNPCRKRFFPFSSQTCVIFLTHKVKDFCRTPHAFQSSSESRCNGRCSFMCTQIFDRRFYSSKSAHL